MHHTWLPFRCWRSQGGKPSGGRSYQQFDTIRQLRVGYSGVYKISAQGLEEGTSYGQGQNHSIFTCCPTEMVWFRGWEDVSLMQMNVALSGNDVRECLKETLIIVCKSQIMPRWESTCCILGHMLSSHMLVPWEGRSHFAWIWGLNTKSTLWRVSGQHPSHPHPYCWGLELASRLASGWTPW